VLFPEFLLVSTQRPYEELRSKNGRFWSPKMFEDFVKIRPAVAEQSRQKKNKKKSGNIRRRLRLQRAALPN